MTARNRVFSLLAAVAAVATIACAESPAAPSPTGARAPRDTTTGYIQGDTTLCRSGYVIADGRYVCL